MVLEGGRGLTVVTRVRLRAQSSTNRRDGGLELARRAAVLEVGRLGRERSGGRRHACGGVHGLKSSVGSRQDGEFTSELSSTANKAGGGPT